MKLLIVNDSGIRGGGAEERIKLLLNELLERKFFKEIHLLFYEKEKQEELKGIIYHPCENSYLSAYFKVEDIIKKYNINLLQVHNLTSLLPLFILKAKKYKLPIIWMAHDFWVLCKFRSLINPYSRNSILCEEINFFKCFRCMGLKTYIRLYIFRKLIGQVNLAIAQGLKVAKKFEDENILKNKWKIVIPWINLGLYKEEFKNFNKKEILFIGPLAPYKGAHIAALALKYVLSEFPQASLKFVGYQQEKENIFRKEIEKIGEKDGTLNKMFFLGEKKGEDLKKEYLNSGVLVFPSIWWETFGLVWAQALACGLPVVASDIGGISEYIKDLGTLFKPGDHLDLAEKIIKIFKDHNLAKEISKKGREYARNNFSPKAAADSLIKIYQEVL